MKKITYKLLIILILSNWLIGCVTTNNTKKFIDDKTAQYTCVDPMIEVSDGYLELLLKERLVGTEIEKTTECRGSTVAERILTDDKNNPIEKATGLVLYTSLSVFTFGLYTAYDAVSAVQGTGKKCSSTELSRVEVKRERPAKGDFTGNISVVPTNYPDLKATKSFSGKLTNFTVPLSQDDSEYAVLIDGMYKSDDVKCKLEIRRFIDVSNKRIN